MKKTKLTSIPVEVLWAYREFKRDEVPAPCIPFYHVFNVEEVTAHVYEHGIKPLELSIIKDKALLTDGNHRIVAARRLGMKEVPVEVTVYFGSAVDIFYQHTLDRFKPISQPLEAWLKVLFL